MDFFKSVGIHFLIGVFYAYLVQIGFLLTYPPFLIFLLLISVYFSLAHRIVQHFQVRIYRSPSFLTSLWSGPLLFMGISTLVVFLILGYSAHWREPEPLKQLLHMPVELSTLVYYLYFILLFTSSTFLFAESCLFWMTKIQPIHLNQENRRFSRRVILFLFLMILGGIVMLLSLKEERLYIKAVLLANLHQTSRAKEILAQTSKGHEPIHYSSLYRLGRLELLRNHNSDRASQHFESILQSEFRPLIQDSLYELLLCSIQGEWESSRIRGLLERMGSSSYLYDEGLLILAHNLEREGRKQEAREVYEQLQKRAGLCYTLRTASLKPVGLQSCFEAGSEGLARLKGFL